jgi:hypothetical protein
VIAQASAQAPAKETWKAVPSAPAVKSDPATQPAVPPTTAHDSLGEPYVTTGVVMITDPTPAASPPSPAAPLAPALPVTHLSPVAVKASIEKTCGPNIRNVEVKLEAGNKVSIQYGAPTAADGQLFFDRIQALPDLAPYEVNVKVTTAK